MRGFMLLSLVTLAISAPQGYNYPEMQRQPHLEYGPAPASPIAIDFLKNLQAIMALQTANIETGDSYTSNSIEQYGGTPQQQNNLPVPPQTQNLLPNFAVPSNSFNSFTPYETTSSDSTQQQHQQQQQQQPIVSKRFFIHSAPEEDDTEVEHKHITVGKPRKNLNVVFIKAPAKSPQRTSLKISPAVNEERTVIYVLAKKQDAADIDAHVIEPVTTTSRPEVFFIKYKTHEEAEHAQRAIQSQYDMLGGSTHISNEGVAPVSSVIGALDAAKQAAGNQAQSAVNDAPQQQQDMDEEFLGMQAYQNQQAHLEDGISNHNNYLPPIFRRH